ncbi:hypothetical protein M3J09_001434 [Ascochyta lentis]
MCLSDRQDGRGSAAGLSLLQILPLSEHCETTLNLEERSVLVAHWLGRVDSSHHALSFLTALRDADRLACYCEKFWSLASFCAN